MEASMEEIPLDDEDSESIEFRVLMAFAQRNLSASRYQEFLKQIPIPTGNGANGGPVLHSNGYSGEGTPREATTSDSKKCKKKKPKWKQLIVPSCIRGQKEIEDDTEKARTKQKRSKKKVPVDTKLASESASPMAVEDETPEMLKHIADRLVEILPVTTDTVQSRALRQSFSVEADGGIDEDQIIEGIVALLRESGDRLNEKIKTDKSLCQGITEVFTSYSSFKKLADQYLGEVVPETETQQSVKAAVAMDVTTRLTAIDNHPMNKVLGFGVKYLKENFSLWIQNRGGWGKALGVVQETQEDVE